MPNILISVLLFLLFLAIAFLGRGLRFYVDWQWFSDVQYLSVFLTQLKGQILVGGGLAGGVFLWCWGHFRWARSAQHHSRPIIADDLLDFPQRRLWLPFLDKTAVLLLAVASLFVGLGLKGWWIDLYQFIHRTNFGVLDPVFSKGHWILRL